MKLYIDGVNIEIIKELITIYPIKGITTNPTILKKYNENPITLLNQIKNIIDEDQELMIQIVSTECDKMLDEALALVKFFNNANIFIKIPTNIEGIKAIRKIKSIYPDIKICATAVYSTIQGLLAAKAGADLIATYVNRIDNLGGDGVKVTKEIHDLIKAYNLKSEILAASFKNLKQLTELVNYGIPRATLAIEIWQNILTDNNVEHAINEFNKDFKALINSDDSFIELLNKE